MSEIDQAIKILKANGVVAIPTETVYGLAGSIESQSAIKKIFSIKERPFFDPLIVHVSDIQMAKKLTSHWNSTAQILAEKFWPGPLTLVLPKSSIVNDLITSGLDSVGIRMPNHSKTLELIKKLEVGVAAPSANKFKKTSPTTKEHVIEEFKEKVFVIDGGPCEIGIESTVVGIKDKSIEIYRPGSISKECIEAVIPDKSIKVNYKASPVAPGQLKHHYMPIKPLRISSKLTAQDTNYWKLPEDPTIAARMLYSKLRELDKQKASEIVFIIPQSLKHNEKWLAIHNRLKKALTYDEYY